MVARCHTVRLHSEDSIRDTVHLLSGLLQTGSRDPEQQTFISQGVGCVVYAEDRRTAQR